MWANTLATTKLELILVVVPNFDDIQELTEVVAFVLESYRWRPVAVGGK